MSSQASDFKRIAPDVKLGRDVQRATSAPGEFKTDADWFRQSTIVQRGASIGSGATLLGITVGKDAIVGAGSVVTKDVPPNTTVAGDPPRILKPATTNHANASAVS